MNEKDGVKRAVQSMGGKVVWMDVGLVQRQNNKG